MSAFDLAKSPFELTPQDFEAVFASAGHDVKIRSLESKSIGTGQIGENVRFKFDFERAGQGVPTSLVGKFPTDNETSLAAARLLGHYKREVFFYRHFPHLAGVITPPALYTDHDEASNRFALIMRDMAPAVQGDQLKGCTPATARLALKSAAIMHAAHWNDSTIDRFDWLQGTDAAPPPTLPSETTTRFWNMFKDRYRGRASAEDFEVGDAYVAAIPKWSGAQRRPFTLTHNDFRLDNMLFAPPGSERELAIVDWQTVGKGVAAIDVAYFIGAGLTREERPKHEHALLDYYYSELTRLGVTSYSRDDLYTDYRRYSFYGISVAFGAAILVKQTDRGDEMFLTMLRRHCAQVRDNNALELLP